MQGLSFFSNSVGAAFEIGEAIFENTAGLMESAVESVGRIGKDENDGSILDEFKDSFQAKILEEKQDKFVKSSEAEDKKKAEEEDNTAKKENNIKYNFNQLKNNSFGNANEMLNEMADAGIISKSFLSNFMSTIENIINDTKSNTATNEAMRVLSSKMRDVEEKLSTYQNDKKAEKEETPFSLETVNDIYFENNPLKTEDKSFFGANDKYFASAANTSEDSGAMELTA